MKKIYFLVSALAMMVCLSCGGSQSSPQAVADKFMTAFLVDFNIGEVRQYVSEELKSDFPEEANMNQLEMHFIDILKEHTKAHGYSFAIDKATSEIDGDDAEIHYVVTAKGNPDYQGEAEIELEKGIDGKWYVTDYEVGRDENAIDFGF